VTTSPFLKHSQWSHLIVCKWCNTTAGGRPVCFRIPYFARCTHMTIILWNKPFLYNPLQWPGWLFLVTASYMAVLDAYILESWNLKRLPFMCCQLAVLFRTSFSFILWMTWLLNTINASNLLIHIFFGIQWNQCMEIYNIGLFVSWKWFVAYECEIVV